MSLKNTDACITNNALRQDKEISVAACEDVYAAKELLGRGKFSLTIFFGCIVVGEVIGAIALLALCVVGIIDPDTYVAAFPLLGGAIVGAIPGYVLARPLR